MNISYNKKKQEAKKDPLVKLIEKAAEFYKKNSNSILITITALIVLTGVYLTFSYVQEKKTVKLQERFGQFMIAVQKNDFDKAASVMNTIVEDYPKSAQASYSAYLRGNFYFEEHDYDRAINWFNKALKNGKESGFVYGEALECLAKCYEAKGDLKGAVDMLEKALQEKENGYRHDAILWKLALIERELGNIDNSIEMCDKLINDKPEGEIKTRANNLKAEMVIKKSLKNG